MKLQLTNHRKAGAFTLIEMIGVLAVIAILAALLIPRVFNAINQARVNGTAVSADTVKTATADHYGKYGKFDYLWGTNQITMPITNYDTAVLMAEGLLDKPFSSKLAGGDPQLMSHIELVVGTLLGQGMPATTLTEAPPTTQWRTPLTWCRRISKMWPCRMPRISTIALTA